MAGSSGKAVIQESRRWYYTKRPLSLFPSSKPRIARGRNLSKANNTDRVLVQWTSLHQSMYQWKICANGPTTWSRWLPRPAILYEVPDQCEIVDPGVGVAQYSSNYFWTTGEGAGRESASGSLNWGLEPTKGYYSNSTCYFVLVTLLLVDSAKEAGGNTPGWCGFWCCWVDHALYVPVITERRQGAREERLSGLRSVMHPASQNPSPTIKLELPKNESGNIAFTSMLALHFGIAFGREREGYYNPCWTGRPEPHAASVACVAVTQ